MLLVEKKEDGLNDDKAYLTFDDAPGEESATKVVSMVMSIRVHWPRQPKPESPSLSSRAW
jgi:hypothetical protein